MAAYTSASGYSVSSERALTNKDVLRMCDILNESVAGQGVRWAPEPISEGGLYVADWGTQDTEKYKTVRFLPRGTRSGKWPEITSKTAEEWRHGSEFNIFFPEYDSRRYGKAMVHIDLYFKAFHGAPCWTLQELKLLEKAFVEVGFKRTSKYPLKTALRDVGRLGYHGDSDTVRRKRRSVETSSGSPKRTRNEAHL